MPEPIEYASLENDIAHFVRVMQSGTDEEQKQAISSACDVALEEPGPEHWGDRPTTIPSPLKAD